MATRILAIDPGKDGFLALLEDGVWSFWPMPVIEPGKKGKRQYNDSACASIVSDTGPGLIVLEKAQAMPGQGVSSMFSIGEGFGLWRGIAAAFVVPILIPHPKTWQKVMLRDIPTGDTKSRALQAAMRLFPGVDLRASDRCRVPHQGKVDAMLMAAWGAMQHG